METIIAVTPAHSLDPRIAIAATRAGEIGILDLGSKDDATSIADALNRLDAAAGRSGQWGVRWDTLGEKARGLDKLAALLQRSIDVLALGGVESDWLARLRKAARRVAKRVFVEVCDGESALAAQAAGYDGLIVKGHEASGRVGKSSSFVLLQELAGKLEIPYWIQGGVGIHTSAAAILSGATGVVLAEQLWTTEEGPYFSVERTTEEFDGSESVVVGRDAELFRLSNRHGRTKLRELELAIAREDEWRAVLSRLLRDSDDPVVPLGQDIAFSSAFARRFATTGQAIAALKRNISTATSRAASDNVLAPDSALAKAHGTRFPIVQGPMTRVSDVAPFAEAVAQAGGLPFLALAVMRGPQARAMLAEAKKLLGQKPWGVGILGFMPLELRQEQIDAIREAKPPFAIIAGGRPSQARELEAIGTSAYLHVPSPGLLKGFIKEGARKFIFEGSECGGHTGPRTSFVLWESAIEALLSAEIGDPQSVQVLFAGGIHDALSAAMVSVLASALSAKGIKIGVLMGTAYLFTQEAVRSGAVVQKFQDEAIACRETALLQSAIGVYTRCAKTEFCDEFDGARRKLLLENKSDAEILTELELLNIGRLRIASKGVVRNDKPAAGEPEQRYVAVDGDTQRREGLYMMGEVARLRSAPIAMADLHKSVSEGAAAILAKAEPVSIRRERRAYPNADIAIVGMACVMPSAEDLRAYWQNILREVDAIREVTPDRWRPEDFFVPKRGTPDKVYSKWGGFIDDIAFDPARYGIPPASLASIEPVQILALHVATKALEDAGFDRRPFPRERTATIFAVGAMNELGTIYVFRTLLAHYLPKVDGLSNEVRERIIADLYREELPKWTEDSFPGFLANVVAGRVANRLDLRGINFTVDAACASSLAALDAGIRQLRSGDADAALVGGVDGSNGAVGFMAFAQTHALSPRGRCRPFDDSADGTTLGEGVAAVILKRLEDAERDGDKIYAVIKGIGSSSDGHNRSLTAPDPRGQVLAIERAYADAGVDPGTVTLIEAHGTGTAVGDKSEIQALKLAYGAASDNRQYCAVGSVKSMIGHTKVTAGLAALIKAALALKHRVLPPTIGVEKPNSRADFAKTPFYINSKLRPWIVGPETRPRRCGVSAFGFGGTNFHAVLEEYRGDYRPSDEKNINPREAEIFAFGRAERGEVETAVKSLLQRLTNPEHLDLAQLAYSAHLEEAKAHPKNGGQVCQLALVASSVADLKAKLEFFLREFPKKSSIKAPQGVYYQEHRRDAGSICMLFPGQGSQRIDMLRDLVLSRPSSYALFERADALLKASLAQPLSRYVYPLPSFTDEERERRQAELNDTRVAQPALGVVDLVGFDILSEFGLRPNFVAGHSYGEYVALCAAGVISRDDLIRLSEARGRIAAEANGEKPQTMAAVNANERQVREAIARLGLEVSVANLNAPDQTIVAGSVQAIEAAVAALKAQSVRAKPISVTAAFHCAAMNGARDLLATELANVSFNRPETPVFSNTTGERYPDDPDEIRSLLARHIAEPLRFVDEIERLYEAGARVFIEVGPGLVLSGLVDRILEGRPHATLALDAPERSGWLQLAHLLAQATALGLPIDPSPWFRNRGLAPLRLAQLFEQAHAKALPGPTVWRINGGRAEPWNRPAKPQKAAETIAARPAEPPITTQARAAIVVSSPAPKSATTRERRSIVSNHDLSVSAAPPLTSGLSGPDPTFSSAQGTLSQLIELQREQQEVLCRFIEFQEHLLLGRSAAHSAPPPVLTQAASGAPQIASAAPPAPAVSPPIPVLPSFVAPNGVRPPAAPIATSPSAAPVATAAPAPASGNGSVNGAARSKESGSIVLPPTEQFKSDLIRAVAERTGYSEDMLDLDAHMEADLGIDSIKRIEILSALKERYPFMEGRDEETVFEELAGIKTLNAVIEWYDNARKSQTERGGSDSAKKSPTPPSLSLPETAESIKSKANADDARRYELAPVAAPRADATEMSGFPADDLILLVGGEPRLSAAFMTALRSRGYVVSHILAGLQTKALDENRFEVDFSSLETVKALHAQISASGRKVGAIFNLPAHDADEKTESVALRHARSLFLLLKVFEKDLEASSRSGGGWLSNLTAFDGQFGLRRARSFPIASAGTLGVAKSVAQEWPKARVKCIDVDPELDADRVAAETLREIAADDLAIEVGFTKDGRWLLDLKERNAAAELTELKLDPDDVVLVTGGAYGITADISRALAEKFRPRLVIVGRSREPAEEPEATRRLGPSELKQFLIREMREKDAKVKPADIERAWDRLIKDRQIRENIAAMRKAGAQVEYHALDLRDSEAFDRLIDAVYQRYGRIDGVLHGAGVIDDKLIRDKSHESFDAVFMTKVAPAATLARKLRPEKLKFVVFFSSIAGRFGNAGQCDYSAANELVNKLAARLSREWPHVHTVAINWGPWDGGMVREDLRKLFAARNIQTIAIEQGRRRCLEELQLGSSGPHEIVVASSLEQIARLASRSHTKAVQETKQGVRALANA